MHPLSLLVMRISLLLCVLLLFSTPSLAEESDGVPMTAPSDTPSCPSSDEVTYAGGYKTLPVTRDKPVCEHAKIDQDIKAIEAEMKLQKDAAAGTAYTKAKAIYTSGQNSKKGTGFRSLSG